MEIRFALPEIQFAAEEFWRKYQSSKIFAFQASMGAGKTTFIRALCEHLKVTDAISSPTFAIINEYASPVAGSIYHMDWYRLKNEEEAIQAGVEECLLTGKLCFIEWPDKAPGLLPAEYLLIKICIVNEDERRLIIEDKVL
jgi:tRNA threonylcarbamoyladenosine biosynthesis protein TsaE